MNDITAFEPQVFRSLTEFAPDWLVTPGDTIADMLSDRGWSQVDFARRAGFSEKHVSQLLKGKGSITQDTALRLEKVLGSTARFWLGLESQYCEQLARKADTVLLAMHANWLNELPLRHMIKMSWVRKFTNKAEQVGECLRFFAVSSVEAWRESCQQPVAAYRASEKFQRSPAIVATWLRQAERMAAQLPCAKFDKAKFELALDEIRALTGERSPANFLPQLQARCAAAGVAVVVVPAPTGCPASGATKWLGGNRALIVLSLRGKTDDKLWFTFFHEAGHLLNHGKSLTFLDILGEDGLHPSEEQEADAFARDHLISHTDYSSFVSGNPMPTKAKVIRFAKQQGIAPGIVVGRLQYDKKIAFSYLNELKVRYVWAHDL